MSERRIATVVMLDVVGSTGIAAQLGDARYRELSYRFGRSVRAGIKRFGGREEDNAGDGFFATFPEPDRAIRFATMVANEVHAFGIEIRSGIHTGQTETQNGKAQGIAVVIGARVMSLAGPGEVLVTNTTKELVTGSGFGFEDFSAHELKGVPGTWRVFAVTSVDDRERPPPLPAEEAARRLDGIQPDTGPAPRRRRAVLVAGAAALVAIAAIAFAFPRDDGTSKAKRDAGAPASKSVVNVDPTTGDILTEIAAPVSQQGGPAGTPPEPVHPIDVGQAAVWTSRSFRLLYRVDPIEGDVDPPAVLEGGISGPYSVAVGYDKVWVSCARGLLEVNPATIEQDWVVHLEAEGAQFGADVTTGAGAVWLGSSDGQLHRIDPRTERVRPKRGLDPIDAIAFGHGSVWTADTFGGSVTRYDPETLEPIVTIEIPSGVDALVAGENAVWALSRSVGVLTEIDVDDNTADRVPIPVGSDPMGLAAAQGSVWVGHEEGVLTRVDEATRQSTDLPFDASVRGLAYDDETDTLWVDVA